MTTMFTALAALLSTSAFALDSFDTFLEPLGYVDGGMERDAELADLEACLLYTSPSPRDRTRSRMPSSA